MNMRLLPTGLCAILTFLGLVSLAQAQDSSLVALASELPSCVLTCFINDLMGPSPSCPDLTDMSCLCNSTELRSHVQTCVLANCTLADSLQAAKASASVCHEQSQNMQGELTAIFASMLALSVAFVAVRLYVRLFLQTEAKMGADDWIIASALVIWSAYAIVVIVAAIPGGLGKDQWELTVGDVELLAFYSWLGQIMYCVANSWVKLGFLFFYLRIFQETNVRYLLLATVGLVSAYAFAFTITDIFLCQPVSFFWTQWTDKATGKCLNYLTPVFVFSGIGIFLDVFIMAIPLFQLRKLNMSLKKKISVALMFSVGIFITVVSIIRFVRLLSVLSPGAATSWAVGQIWSTVEVSVGIMCACFPACRVLLVHFFSKKQPHSASYYTGSYGQSNQAYGSKTREKSRRRGNTTGSLPTDLGGAAHVDTTTSELSVKQDVAYCSKEDDVMELTQYPETPGSPTSPREGPRLEESISGDNVGGEQQDPRPREARHYV